MSKLTQDCLYIIFKEFKNNINYLHSCLLVNRLWCETIVPILWRNPWEFCRLAEISERDQHFNSLYKILVLLLPSESKELLINNGVDFVPASFRKPLFNYICFIKFLDTYEINRMTQKLIRSSSSLHDLFENEMLKMFMSQSQRLKHLLLASSGSVNEFYQLPGAKDCLSNLVTLTCSVEINPSIFYGLSQVCHNISKLHIYDCYADNVGLISLIEAQKNLKYFISEFNYYRFVDIECKGIGNALAKHVHSLISFDSNERLTLHPSIFKQLINLRILKLGEGILIDKYDFYLQQVILPKLECLEIGWTSLDTVAKIIQSTKGNLIEIRIIEEQDFTKENTSMFLEAIITNCPNLKFATLFYYDKENLKELKELFLSCPYLERLVFIHSEYNIDFEDYDDELLELLEKYATLTLKTIKVVRFNFSIKNLESFLEKWKIRQQPLTFYNICYDEEYKFFNEKHYILFDNYIRKGVIKEFVETIGNKNLY